MTVLRWWCVPQVTRRSLGYAYVNFHNVQDAERALDTMNFTDIKGRPCRIMWSQRDPSLRKSGVGNVFVKNLAPSVDNKALFDTFSVFGNILSCKVATDENGQSKGYGYVHYETAEAAQDAIQKFNGNFIDDMEVYVGPFVRRQERGQNSWTNLYVKMFPTSWSEDDLRALFAEFGALASVVISKDAEGKSKGFGFVNFSDHEAAENAVKGLNGKAVEDPVTNTTTELYVSRAQKKLERTREIKTKMDAMKEERVSKFQGMNLYVKNLDESITDENFREIFSKYGTITSARVMRDPADSASKGFGFVCYSSPEEATAAVNDQNGKIHRGKPILVTLHQRKDLRRAHLAATHQPRMRFQGGPGNMPQMPFMPMYVPQPGQPGGNFPPRGPFGPYGGQGFAPRGGNNSPRGMPYAGRGGPPSPPGPGGFYQMGPYGPGPNMGGMPGQYMNRGGRGMPMGMGQPGQQPRGAPGAGPNNRPGQPLPNSGRGSPGRQQPQGQPMMMGGPMMGPGGPQQQMQGARAGVKFNSNVRNQQGLMMQQGMMMPQQPMQQPLPPQAQPQAAMMGGLDDQALAQADPHMQKNMIGERLYPLIYAHQPKLAGKITGMLLEMDNAELLNLIESPDALMHKIEEALVVLSNHQGADE
jgi:polyadenylate-binding protein